MTAPATSHDLRCVQASSPDLSVPCTCSRGSVLRLPVRPDPSRCVMCGGIPAWLVNGTDRSCSADLVSVLDDIYLDRWDGFAPITVARLVNGRVA